MAVAEELPIDTSATALEMAQTMFGNGISILSASYEGATAASGIFTDGDTIAPGVTPSDTGVILSTGNAEAITNSSGDANVSAGTSTDHGLAGDSDLDGISGQQTFDAAVFEATFVPEGSTLTMQITFSSEEYLEYVSNGFNDAVGVFVNGEQATLTVGDGGITIDNINDTNNSNLYVDNPSSAETLNTEMDGMTITLTLKAPVTPGAINTIKIGIADSGDGSYDSNLMIAGDSVQTQLIALDDEIELEANSTTTVDFLSNDTTTAGGTLTIISLNGQAVEVGDTVTLSTGEMISLTPTGMVLVGSDSDVGSSVISYEVMDEAGNTDVAFATITTTVSCFTAGANIATQRGQVLVENLTVGDSVQTRDHGVQPIRWVGTAMRHAKGPNAPIVIAKGAFGNHEAVTVSQNHRILIRSAKAETMFGDAEILVAAKHLLCAKGVSKQADGKPIKYVHFMFDQHEIVEIGGLESESFHPCQYALNGLENKQREEILDLFPSLRNTSSYGPTARITLKAYEAQVFIAA